jgi:uncharacterized OB-fold protein
MSDSPKKFMEYNPYKKEEKKGDYLECPKCGRTMEILFQVPECPYCDRKGEDKKKEKEISDYGDIRRWYKTDRFL